MLVGDRLEVGQRRGDESIEPMSKVKDLKSAFELSLIKINEQKNSITKLSKLCLGALNAIDRIESNIESEKENARKETAGKGKFATFPLEQTPLPQWNGTKKVNDKTLRYKHI